jgi:hypothetical protein
MTCFPSAFSTEEQDKRMKEFSELTGLPQAALIRALLDGYQPKARPGEEFHAVIRELHSIGNNLVHIRIRAEQLGYANLDFLDEQLQGIYELRRKLMEVYCLPDKVEAWWMKGEK